MKHVIITLITTIFFFLVFPLISQANAGFLKFDQTTYTTSGSGTFSVQAVIDAGSDQIKSTDIWVTYDATVIEAQSIAAGTFFPTVTNNITSGKVYIAGYVDSSEPTGYKTGSGTVATITFKGIKNGTSPLSFNCQEGSSDSSTIGKNDYNATNVIVCSQNVGATVTVSGVTSSSSSSSNSSSSSSSSSSSGPTPSVLPQTGIWDNVLKLAIPGMILFIIGTAVRLFL